MITLIQTLHYRCLKFVDQDLQGFHALVGPNASGKTTFLDVVSFLGTLVSAGLERAVQERTNNFEDLTWRRENNAFELAIECSLPKEIARTIPTYNTIRYEIAIGLNKGADEINIYRENVWIKKKAQRNVIQRELFPDATNPPESLLKNKIPDARKTISKAPGQNDNFYSEVYGESGKGWVPSFKLGPKKSALGNLPADESKFPASAWLKEFLSGGVQQLQLNSVFLRKPSPPGQGKVYKADGANLPWVIEVLRQNHLTNYHEWLAHVQTALPDITDIITVERPEDRHRYLVIKYQNGLEVPSWMASDGTLRLLALTVIAYLPDFRGVYLIEEPENGIHPCAVETVCQSLSSVYDAQVLVATHSPVILNLMKADQILCFAKNGEGATDIILGSAHPALRKWKGETNLGVLFAGGVLG